MSARSTVSRGKGNGGYPSVRGPQAACAPEGAMPGAFRSRDPEAAAELRAATDPMRTGSIALPRSATLAPLTKSED